MEPEAKKILDKFWQLQDDFQTKTTPKPFLLAHYTSTEVAEKIIRSEEIWLSHPFFMNDLEELRAGMILGMSLFPQFAHVASGGNPNRLQLLVDSFNHYIGHMNEQTLPNTYILCLSEHMPGDTDGVLSMWRSYGSQGHGVALVFNMDRLPNPPQAPLAIQKVKFFSPAERQNFLSRKLQEWALITQALRLPNEKIHLASLAAFWFVKTFALVTKHHGFREENEWRIIYTPEYDPEGHLASQFGYFISARGVEPKLKFKIAPVLGGDKDSLSLKGLLQFILLGPSTSSLLAKQSFCRILRDTCLSGFDESVHASTIPLRPVVP